MHLKNIYETQTDPFYREHVTSYITSHLDDFGTSSLVDDEDNSGIRVTVDTVNDYILSCVLNEILMEAVAMQDVFGLFYSWDEAVSACPEGWRLPDADDWKDLATAHGCADTEDVYAGIGGKLMADAYMNDMKMWEFWPDVKITNNLRFCAIPTGYALDADGSYTFKGSSHYAVFWTAEENGEEQAWCRQLYVKSNDVYKASMYKSAFRAPVRCVRTAE